MDNDTIGFIIVLTLGLFVGFIIGAIVVNETIVKDLGNAICKEEYNMEYKGYIVGELVCEFIDIEQKEQYDGIKVKLK